MLPLSRSARSNALPDLTQEIRELFNELLWTSSLYKTRLVPHNTPRGGTGYGSVGWKFESLRVGHSLLRTQCWKICGLQVSLITVLVFGGCRTGAEETGFLESQGPLRDWLQPTVDERDLGG
jgi:hypothetical protein